MEFHIPDRVMALTVPEQSGPRLAFEDTGRAYVFRITGRNHQQFAAWPAFDEPLDTYSYHFVPTTIGEWITVTHHASATSAAD